MVYSTYFKNALIVIAFLTIFSTGAFAQPTIPGLPNQTDDLLSPKLISPANQAEDIDPVVLFSWEAANNAETYQLQLSINENFNDILTDSTDVVSTELELRDLTFNTVYYWRVRSIKDSEVSDWSDTFSFKTAAEEIDIDVDAVVLANPVNNEENVPIPTEFVWFESDEAVSYTFHISKSSDFTSVNEFTDITDTTITIAELDFNTLYFWRVRAHTTEDVSDWSETFKFTTQVAIPQSTILTSPENNASDISLPAVFAWIEVENADYYQIQISENNDFTSPQDSTNISDTTLTLSELSFESSYSWRVRAHNATGVGAWSETWTFSTIVEKPGEVVIVSPDYDEETTTSLKLIWEPADRAANYRIQLSINEDFSDLILNEVIPDTSYIVEDLLDETQYYLQIRAENDGGQGAWTVSRFTTAPVTFTENDFELPKDLVLHQNYPNPFNPTTLIRFDLPADTHVHLSIYTLDGRLISTLVNENRSSGFHSINFDASSLASGLYIYRLRTENNQRIGQMTLIK